MAKEHVRRIHEGGVYCAVCKTFLGSTCDPFAPTYCTGCFPTLELAEKRALDPAPPHVLLEPKDCPCDGDPFCNICEGGLGLCRVCGKAEIELDEPCTPKK